MCAYIDSKLVVNILESMQVQVDIMDLDILIYNHQEKV